jgi:2,4-dienoyl-CoA reductase-like NADH-dependent reductase (Old Yellow Enzyme family)
MYTDSLGMQPRSTPRAMSESDIAHAVDEYAKSAQLAIEAGFDGVELHAANGYLIEQFLNANVNRRADAYGGTIDGRNRFALEVARATAAAIGARRSRRRRRASSRCIRQFYLGCPVGFWCIGGRTMLSGSLCPELAVTQ